MGFCNAGILPAHFRFARRCHPEPHRAFGAMRVEGSLFAFDPSDFRRSLPAPPLEEARSPEASNASEEASSLFVFAVV
jgi:hypothetical protein